MELLVAERAMSALHDYHIMLKRREEKRRKRLAKRKLLMKDRPIKLTERQIRKQLEEVTHTTVKIRDKRVNNGMCLTCNKRPINSANHIIAVDESLWTAYDTDNMYGGCNVCNWEEKKQRGRWQRPGGKFWEVFGAEKLIELNGRAHPRDAEGNRLMCKRSRAEWAAMLDSSKIELDAVQRIQSS